MNTIKMIAVCACSMRAVVLYCLVAGGLAGCGVMQPAPRPVVYDFGPGAVSAAGASPAAGLPALMLADVEAPASLDSTAVLYRLEYSDAQQLRPYAQARWSMPPAQLLRQRLREALGQQRVVLQPGEGVIAAVPAPTLRIALEEFSQLFETPEKSRGLLRLRATLSQGRGGSERVLAQRSFVVQHDSASADAAGGVRALTAATDAVIADIDQWVRQYP
ncbi:MAG: membrane integrity-associated transporter subunit PqiC [Burkholderiales bacterium]|nr:membrane integrity-associated transporter subunit PqiC [Burkholderiales bacterium]